MVRVGEGDGATWYLSRGGAANLSIITSWTTSARCLISSGVRTFLIMSILTSGIFAVLMLLCLWSLTGL